MDVIGLYAVDRATTYALSHRDRLIQIPNCFKMSSQTFGEVVTSIPG